MFRVFNVSDPSHATVQPLFSVENGAHRKGKTGEVIPRFPPVGILGKTTGRLEGAAYGNFV